MVLTSSLVILNAALAVLCIRGGYVAVLTTAVIELLTSPLALPSKYLQIYLAIALIATSVPLSLLNLIKSTKQEGRSDVVALSVSLLLALGIALAYVALTYNPPPDLFRVAKVLAERRLITWRCLGVLAGALNVLAAYYVLKGKLVNYLLCVGLFLSPIILATQSLPKPSPTLWAQTSIILTTYVLGALALRGRY